MPGCCAVLFMTIIVACSGVRTDDEDGTGLLEPSASMVEGTSRTDMHDKVRIRTDGAISRVAHGNNGSRAAAPPGNEEVIRAINKYFEEIGGTYVNEDWSGTIWSAQKMATPLLRGKYQQKSAPEEYPYVYEGSKRPRPLYRNAEYKVSPEIDGRKHEWMQFTGTVQGDGKAWYIDYEGQLTVTLKGETLEIAPSFSNKLTREQTHEQKYPNKITFSVRSTRSRNAPWTNDYLLGSHNPKTKEDIKELQDSYVAFLRGESGRYRWIRDAHRYEGVPHWFPDPVLPKLQLSWDLLGKAKVESPVDAMVTYKWLLANGARNRRGDRHNNHCVFFISLLFKDGEWGVQNMGLRIEEM